MIRFRELTLRRGPLILLEHVNWTIYAKQRIGLIGANGAGKTSLFSLLLGELAPDAGSLDLPKQLHIAHVAQETEARLESALNFVLDGDQEYRKLQQALNLAEQAENWEKIATLHGRMEEIDAYRAPARAAQLLAGLGFSHAEQSQAVSCFSGGWRVRLNLARALMCRSEVLLLDEPTNHLDLDAVIWLEQWLKNYPGTLIIISHDREFLDQTVDHIAHLSQQTIKVYSGNYSAFEILRAQHILLQQAAYEKQQKHIAHLQSFINRFKAKATKAKQAQSRIKAIERMEILSAVLTEAAFSFEFKPLSQAPNPLLQLNQASIAYGERTIINNINFSIAPQDRIAILGPNGAGKTSFIKLLAGEILPATGGRVASPGLKIGYFAQHQIDQLNLDESPLDHLRQLSKETPELACRTYLGSFGFSGERVDNQVKFFSGGEKSRLALALLVWQQPNLLLLDEPTNHLDMDMRNSLSLALQHYEGAMVLVTHDRFLVRSTVDILYLVAETKLKLFEGDLDDYQQWLLNFRKQQQHHHHHQEDLVSLPLEIGRSRKEERRLEAKQREARRPLLQKIKKLEDTINQKQKALAQIEAKLIDPALYEVENKKELNEILQQEHQLKKELNMLEESWLSACEQRDQSDES